MVCFLETQNFIQKEKKIQMMSHVRVDHREQNPRKLLRDITGKTM
jgi:hypothetical protein